MNQVNQSSIVQLSGYRGWIVGVSCSPTAEYCCWAIAPNLLVLNNGERYGTSSAAMAAGRSFVERHSR